jgi:YebC/PmpR family DNA-binding regulatory protein
MSGHSKWTQIKRQKAVADKKKGNVFTKLGNAITVAARQGGVDPTMNFKLRIAVEKAKAANMPNENITRATKKGAGGAEGVMIEEAVYEGFGPGGAAIIVEAATDNKNRTTSTLRNIFSKHQSHLGHSGSVAYLFQTKGVARILKSQIKNKDELELKLIDAGADDILEEEEGFTVYAAPTNITAVKDALEKMKVAVESSDIELVPLNKISLPDEQTKTKLSRLLEELESADDITNYFTNADL